MSVLVSIAVFFTVTDSLLWDLSGCVLAAPASALCGWTGLSLAQFLSWLSQTDIGLTRVHTALSERLVESKAGAVLTTVLSTACPSPGTPPSLYLVLGQCWRGGWRGAGLQHLGQCWRGAACSTLGSIGRGGGLRYLRQSGRGAGVGSAAGGTEAPPRPGAAPPPPPPPRPPAGPPLGSAHIAETAATAGAPRAVGTAAAGSQIRRLVQRSATTVNDR